MDPAKFRAPRFGSATREPGDKWAFWYFLPASVPRDLALDPLTVAALSDADAALGQLQGLGRLIRDPELLIGPYITREAVASSRIEGTEASLSDVLQAEAGGNEPRTEDVAEVTRYVEATRQGLELVKTLPLTRRLICELHRTLLASVRGTDKLPGEFRRSPVWVGSATDRPDTATYVPPLPSHIPDLFSDWERYVNEEVRVPPLIRAGLMHYQFETIHPFLDGNGRIGRLLIGLVLLEAGRLPTPLLYISGYLEMHRREYYDRLQAVRERGEVQEWLQFFLTAVTRQAEDASTRAMGIIDVRERYQHEAMRSRSRLSGVVELMMTNPFITVARVERALSVTNQGARNLIRDAEARGWLQTIESRGRGGRAWWVAREVWDVIEAPAAYQRNEPMSDSSPERTVQ